MDIASHVLLKVPLQVAFDYYRDQDRLQDWVPGGGILEFTPLTPPPKKVGSRYRMAYKSLGVTFRLVTELTVLEKDRRSAMDQITGDYESFHYEMTFSSAGPDCSRMEMRIRAKLPWGRLGLIADWLSRPFVRRDISRALERFKREVELLQYPSQSSGYGAIDRGSSLARF